MLLKFDLKLLWVGYFSPQNKGASLHPRWFASLNQNVQLKIQAEYVSAVPDNDPMFLKFTAKIENLFQFAHNF